MMLPRIQENLLKYCKVDRKLPLVIGVSGGADSLALLHILAGAGCVVTVAHFNHHLRPEAEGDAIFVAEMADKLNVPFFRGDGDVAGIAAAQKISLETAARKARYRFMFEVAEKIGAQAVATAHTADDQAETVLLHLIRGTGLKGLRGMQPRTMLAEFSTKIQLVRPMLNTWRYEIDAYCKDYGIEPRVDSTNQDPGYTRNRIRLELIPLLETYNPKIKARLGGLTANVRNSIEILEPVIRMAYGEANLTGGAGVRSFDQARLTTFSPAIQVEVIRLAVEELLPEAEDIDQAAIERAASLLTIQGGSHQIEMADGITARISSGRFFINLNGSSVSDPAWPEMAEGPSVALRVPDCLILQNGWEIRSEWIDTTDVGSLIIDDLNTAVLDGDAISFPLSVRRRAAGDSFQPLGLARGSLTLGDFYTNEKMPREARAAWPIVVSGDRIVWVPGYRIADFVKVQENSRRLVRLQLIKSTN
jgi:tRNA(Ile)-lysidine synthase